MDFGLAITVAFLSWGTYLFNSIVPEAYMDEIFHIPQAQQYCVGNFSYWDSKITTPPGLYLISLIITPSLLKCTVYSLRITNAIFGALIYVVIAFILKTKGRPSTTAALSGTLLPVSFFYNFLYYTDSGSTFFVLLSYALAIKNNFLLSSLVPVLSLNLGCGCCNAFSTN